MGGHDHCCAVGCKTGRGKLTADGRTVSLYTFPKDQELRQLWVNRVNRADLRLENVTSNTVLCSEHFVNRQKTADQPDPVFFAHRNYQVKRKQRLPLEFVPARKRPCRQPKTLAALARDEVQKQIRMRYSLEAENAILRERLRRATFDPSSFAGKDCGRTFKTVTGIGYPVFSALVKYLKPTFSSLYLRHGKQQPLHDEVSQCKLGRP